MKKYFLISGFNLEDSNRGTAALSYGSISFLEEHKYLLKKHTLINYHIYNNPFKANNRKVHYNYIEIEKHQWHHISYPIFFIEMWLINKFNIILPFTYFGKTIQQIEIVAAINGGDGFADIYGNNIFKNRLHDINLAIKFNIPLIFLPQTIGPFKQEKNKKLAIKILHYDCKIFIRDDKYIKELKKENLNYEITQDLSYYMKPQPWNIEIQPNAIGINVSGLAYDNQFPGLEKQFDTYPDLINLLIQEFQKLGKTIYLIPHSYNYHHPDIHNDDLSACRAVYNRLNNKNNIILLDQNLISPQIKYVISQMSFFIGTRMHANFAAIYTNVPLFGLAYSYKFQGAFERHGIYNRTSMINNISIKEAKDIIKKIVLSYTNDTNSTK